MAPQYPYYLTGFDCIPEWLLNLTKELKSSVQVNKNMVGDSLSDGDGIKGFFSYFTNPLT